MPIPLPNLDDRRFNDLVKEVRTLIPQYAPAWTDHNASDPGITLIELFAWVTESLFYRANLAHITSEARLLELLGAEFNSAKPANVNLLVKGSDQSLVILRGAVLTATTADTGQLIKYETVNNLVFEEIPGQPGTYQGRVQARQTEHIDGELLGVSNGTAFQRFPLAKPFVFIGENGPVGLVPQIYVDGVEWIYKRTLLESGPDNKHFTVDTRTSMVHFGNGNSASGSQQGVGLIPPADAQITIDYYYTRASAGNVPVGSTFAFVEDYTEGNGAPLEIAREYGTQDILGTDPTSLQEAKAQVINAQKTPYRAITSSDFEYLVLTQGEFYLARAKCLAGVDLSVAEQQDSNTEDHVSVIIVPKSSSIESAAYSANGAYIVTASSDAKATLWYTSSAKLMHELTGHEAAVLSVSFSPDSTRVVSASEDNTARIWHVSNGIEYHVLTGHTAAVYCAAFSPDGQKVVTASQDATARLWDVISGMETLAFTGHSATLWSVAFSPDGQYIVTASDDRTARIWDSQSGAAVRTLTGHSASVRSAAYAPDGSKIATASVDGTARLWDAASGQLIRVLSGHGEAVNSAAFSPDGSLVVTASNDKTVRVWDAASGEILRILVGHGAAVRSAGFSADGTNIVTASKDGTARLWNAIDGRELNSLMIEDHKPVPTQRDVQEIDAYLDKSRLITCRHHVVIPRYTPIWIKAEVAAEKRVRIGDMGDAVKSALGTLFHPLSGGPDSDAEGWPFGRDVYAAEVYQVIEGVDGIDHVKALWLKTIDGNGNEIDGNERIEIPERNLLHFDRDRTLIEVYGVE